jgi:xanthine dehydrogenase YagS FAD-binding subunit
MRRFEYRRPGTVEDACEQLGDGAPAFAGGTDLLTLVKAGLRAPDQVVDIKRSGLRADVVDHGDHVSIGALATLHDVEHDEVVRDRLTALAEAAGLTATPQLRHRATIAGNLLQRPRCWYFRTPEVDCWLHGGHDCPARTGRNEHHAIFDESPCVAVHPSDLAGPLVALDAVVRLQGRDGSRTVAVADLLAAPTDDRRRETTIRADEIVTAVDVPTPGPIISTYRKAMDRATWAFALAGVAVAARRDGDRLADVGVVLSGVANTPHRATASEAVLREGGLTAATVERAAAAAVDGAAPLAENGYKRPLVVALTAEALHELRRRI